MRSVATFRPGHRRSRRRSSRSPCSLRPTQSDPRAVETNRSTQRAVTSSSSRSGKTWPSFFNTGFLSDLIQLISYRNWMLAAGGSETLFVLIILRPGGGIQIFCGFSSSTSTARGCNSEPGGCLGGLCVEIEFKRAVTKRGWRGEGRIVGGRWVFHILTKSNLTEQWKQPGCQS